MNIKTSSATHNIFSAILKAKKQFTTIIKDASNSYFSSKYETLNGVLDSVEEALMKEGILILQPLSTDGVSNFVTTRLQHVESEEFVESTLKLELSKSSMQEVGSASTYARRQTLKGLLALKAEDDDANVASGLTKETPAPKAKSGSFRKASNGATSTPTKTEEWS